MFAFVENPEFTHDVKVQTPVDGGHRTDTFKCRYKVLDAEKLMEYALSSSFSAENAIFLRDVIVSFSDLVDDKKEAIPYNDELRDKVIATPYAQMALMQTYLDAISKVKQGN